jgi:beta-galactosidase GanA
VADLLIMAKTTFLLLAASCCAAVEASYPAFSDLGGKPYNVSYDARALTIDGSRAIFLSGAVHPPRGTQDDWNSWFDSAKKNGLNMLQVYVFWNFHEEVEGEFNFEGRGDLSEFVRRAGAAGLFVNLRIGPYVCAEWTYGGLPAWLGQKPGVAFRQTNPVWQPAVPAAGTEPSGSSCARPCIAPHAVSVSLTFLASTSYQHVCAVHRQMAKFFNGIVDRMAQGGHFATQGGPIVLVQVENELPATDKTYVEWCGSMAHAALARVRVRVPVTMCNGETASTAINSERVTAVSPPGNRRVTTV